MQTTLKQGDEVHADALATWLLDQASKRLFLVMGLPASGKSSVSKKLEAQGALRLNRDLIRKRLYGDEGTIGDQKEVNREFYKDLRAAFGTGKPVISDNVNLTFAHRKGAMAAAYDHDYKDITIVFVDVPLARCKELNKNRDRHVDEKIMEAMHADFVKEGLPSEWEGKLVVLNHGKDEEHYRIDQIRDRDGDVPAGAFEFKGDTSSGKGTKAGKGTVDAAELIAKRTLLVGSLHDQQKLFEYCVKTGRDAWAAETLTTISRIAADGVPLFGPAAASPVAAPAVVKKPRIPATPEQVHETLMKMIGHRPEVKGDDAMTALCFNGYLLDKPKAELMLAPLLSLVKRAHVVFLQETNVDAARVIARAAKYGLNASHRNVRGQACCMLYHPRMQWLGDKPFYHDYLLDVPGHPEYKDSLRPGLQQRLKDRATDFIFDVVNLHGKSNLGEPDATRPTRRWAFEAFVAKLAEQLVKSPYGERPKVSELSDYSGWDLPLGAVMVGGDYNCPIENPETTEIQPMIQAGFARVSTPDKAWSYRFGTKGGQFDGFFIRGLQEYLAECFIPAFFPKENKQDTAFYRELSDHMPVFASFNLPDRRPAAATTGGDSPATAPVTAEVTAA